MDTKDLAKIFDELEKIAKEPISLKFSLQERKRFYVIATTPDYYEYFLGRIKPVKKSQNISTLDHPDEIKKIIRRNKIEGINLLSARGWGNSPEEALEDFKKLLQLQNHGYMFTSKGNYRENWLLPFYCNPKGFRNPFEVMEEALKEMRTGNEEN